MDLLLIKYPSHIRRIDGQLDSLQLHRRSSPSSPEAQLYSDGKQESPEPSSSKLDGSDPSRLVNLQASVKFLSTDSSLRAILDPPAILAILHQARLLGDNSNPGLAHDEEGNGSHQEQDLEWLLIGKVTTQVYGMVLTLLLDQTIPLSNDIAYWDEVLGSSRYTALYTVQTSPLRLWRLSQDILQDARDRFQFSEDTSDEHASPAYSLLERWSHFYTMVKESIHKHALADMQSKLMSPLTISQGEVRSKRRNLKRLRQMSASGLGILVDEGMMLDSGDEDSVSSKARSDEKEEWKSVVSKSVSLMEAVLRNITLLEMGKYCSFALDSFPDCELAAFEMCLGRSKHSFRKIYLRTISSFRG